MSSRQRPRPGPSGAGPANGARGRVNTGCRGGGSQDAGSRGAGSRGSGLLGALGALLVFLLLLFAAVQVLFSLHADSMVTSAGFEAARVVAGFDRASERCRAVPAGEQRFREALGRFGAAGSVRLDWTCDDPGEVRLAVAAEYPTVLPPFLRGLTGLGRLDRTIAVRVEARR